MEIRSPKHIPAFTLVELMVTLALVGIVLSLGLLVVNVLGSLHHRYEQKVEDTYAISQVRLRLQQDLKATHHLDYKPQEIGFAYTQGETMVTYAWQDSLIIRQTDAAWDTLPGKWDWQTVADPNMIHWIHYPSQLPIVLRLPFTATLRTP